MQSKPSEPTMLQVNTAQAGSSGEMPKLAAAANTLKYHDDRVLMLDRRRLPDEEVWQEYTTYEEVAQAIEQMVIQGAGAVSYAAGFGLALALAGSRGHKGEEFGPAVQQAASRLRATRPTGEQLAPLVDVLEKMAVEVRSAGQDPVATVVREVEARMGRADAIARKCGQFAADLLDDGDAILTHCYPGGALLYMLDHARNQGKHITVYSTETRPYLQGARLTAACTSQMGFDTTLITDNMPAFLMYQGKIAKFVTACDRISLDGHVANKVGTYQYAICCNYHRIPFIVLGYAGPRAKSPDSKSIEVEERDPEEVLYCRGVRTAAQGVKGYYPAFDITPPTLVTAIVTDKGILSPLQIKTIYGGKV